MADDPVNGGGNPPVLVDEHGNPIPNQQNLVAGNLGAIVQQGGHQGPPGGPPGPGDNPPPAGPPGGQQVAEGASYWGPIFTWLSESPELAQWLTDAQREVLTGEQADELPVWAAAMVYQGFDIKRILKLMITRSNAYMAAATRNEVRVNVTVNNQQVPFVYSNMELMAKDIEMIIFLFAERGNTVQKIVRKSIPAIGTIMDWMIAKYQLDVVPHDPGATLDPELVTISRVVSCMPMKLCEYFHRGYGNALYRFVDIGIPNAPNRFSRAILSPHLVSMLPARFVNQVDQCHDIFFLAHVRVDSVIHRRRGNYTSLRDIFVYYAAEYNTPISDQSARVRFFRKIGYVIGNEDTPIAAFTNAGQRAHNMLVELVGEDPNFDQVMDDLTRL